MMKTGRLILICTALVSTLLGAISVPPALAQLREQALGVWVEEDGEAQIGIAPCQDKLCGHIVWLKNPTDNNGQSLMDVNNPNPALRTRPILGLLIMAGLQPNDDNTYLEGRVYNSEDGKIYDIYLTPKGDTMEVEGCLLGFLCASQTWTRAR
jgi:uncharacterized protein (DUF2147 family)